MAYSELLYIGDGVTADFGVTFSYLDQSHIRVAVDKVLTSAVGSNYKFEFINSTVIRVRTVVNENPVPSGLEIRVFRQTPIENPAVVFGGGASLSSANLNKNSEYLTFALQEATDANDAFTRRYLGAFDEAPTTDNVGGPLLVGTMYFNLKDEILNFWNGTTWKEGDLKELTETYKNQAQDAQAASEAALDEFRDLYLGAYANEPTLDNDGDALQDGALFTDTTVGRLKFYDTGTTSWKTSTPGTLEQSRIDTVSNNIVDINTVENNLADVTTVASNELDIQTLADVEDGTVSLNSLSTLSSISTDITTVSDVSLNVITVADNASDVTTVAGISPDVTTVATNDANVTTVAASIDGVNTVSSISDDVTNVSTNMTSVQDASGPLEGFQTAILQMATAFTNSQERFVSKHAFT